VPSVTSKDLLRESDPLNLLREPSSGETAKDMSGEERGYVGKGENFGLANGQGRRERGSE